MFKNFINKIVIFFNNVVKLSVKVMLTTVILLAYSVVMVNVLKTMIHPVAALFLSTSLIVLTIEYLIHKDK